MSFQCSESDASKLDLGTLHEPVICFGGPATNLTATSALLNKAKQMKITQLICTGDIAFCCATANQVCHLIKKSGAWIVTADSKSNFVARQTDQCIPEHSCETINPVHRNWLATMPGCLRFMMGGVRWGVFHRTPAPVNNTRASLQPIWPSSNRSEKYQIIENFRCDAVVAGQCGIPFSQCLSGSLGPRLWHNPGALGVPANDGTDRVWYSILEPSGCGVGVIITHKALAYNVKHETSRMRKAGMPGSCTDCLETGLWPNPEVLPPTERRATGQKLTLDNQRTVFFGR